MTRGAVGLYTHIQSNNLRSAFLLAGFPVLLLGLTYALTLGLIGFGLLPSTGSTGGDFVYGFQLIADSAPLADVFLLDWLTVAYFGNQLIIDLATGARKVDRRDEPGPYN